MNRREYLATVGALTTATALAGCGGAEEGEDFELVGHDFSPTQVTNAIEFEATVENISDEEQNISVRAELYQGDTLLDDATAFFSDLPSGTESTETGIFTDTDLNNIDDVERYVLKNDSGVDDAAELEEHDGERFREKLGVSE